MQAEQWVAQDYAARTRRPVDVTVNGKPQEATT
jgi:hypothetical protein